MSRARAGCRATSRRCAGCPPSWRPATTYVIVGGLPGLFLADELAERLVARVALLEAERVGADWPSRPQAAPATPP